MLKRRAAFLLLLIVSVFETKASISELVNIEDFTFYTEDSILISGKQYLPIGNVKKILIQLYTTHLEYCFPEFRLNADTVRFRNIISLVKEGYGVILISPRLKFVKENIPKLKHLQTYETQATDVEYLCSYLRNKRNLENVPIGVLGYSAAGISAAKIAARNTSVDFAMLIVTPGTSGLEDFYYKWNTGLKESAKNVYLYYFNLFSKFFPNQFSYEGVIYKGNISEKFVECVWKCVKDIHANILQKYENNDSIMFLAKKMFEEKFQTKNAVEKLEFNLREGSQMYSVDDFLTFMINELLFSPLDIDYLKWEPVAYYVQIKCPVLLVFAENDINIDTHHSVLNTRQIITLFKKTDFSLVIIPDVDHNFYESNSKFEVKESDGTIKLMNRQSDVFFAKLLCWLDRMQL